MSKLYCEELRKVHQEIQICKQTLSEAEKEQKNELVLGAVNRIIELAILARKEGLLALEEAVEHLEGDSGKKYLKNIIMLVVDGTEPEDIAQIGMSRYYSSLTENYEAITLLLYLEGGLSIQRGDNPRIIEEKVKAMLPNELYEKFTFMQDEEQKRKEQEVEATRIERLCGKKEIWKPKDHGLYVMKLVDYVICDMSDKKIQRILREIDIYQLALVMKGMSGEARRHIFGNLSERLAKLVAEDMENMGPVRGNDILEVAQRLLNIIIRLMKDGEIVGNYDYLVPFFDLFRVDTEMEQNKTRQCEALKKLVEEYEYDLL